MFLNHRKFSSDDVESGNVLKFVKSKGRNFFEKFVQKSWRFVGFAIFLLGISRVGMKNKTVKKRVVLELKQIELKYSTHSNGKIKS